MIIWTDVNFNYLILKKENQRLKYPFWFNSQWLEIIFLNENYIFQGSAAATKPQIFKPVCRYIQIALSIAAVLIILRKGGDIE